MSLFVYYSPRGENYHREIIKSKAAKANLLPNVNQKEEFFADDHICILSLSPFRQDKVLITDEYVLALEGDIINMKSLSSIIKLYKEEGDKITNMFNGNFNLIIYDRTQHTFKLFNCLTSLYNFYYYQLSDGYIFASNIRSIVRCMDVYPELDYSGVYTLFSFNYIFNNSTLIRGIQRLNPASIVSVQENNMKIRPYWQPEFKDFYDYNLIETAEAFNQKMIEATKLRYSYFKDIKIFLSGGLDSRLIAAAAEKAGIQTETVTYGFKGSNDLIFGKECSERLGYPNHQYITTPGKSTKYSALLSLVVWLTGASTNIASMTSSKYHKFLIELGIKYYSHGSTIGSLSSRHNQPYMFYPIGDDKKILITYNHFVRSAKPVVKTIFKNGYFKVHDAIVKEKFTDTFRHIKGSHFADKFVCWALKYRLPGTVYNSIQVDNYYFNSIHFFQDVNLMDFYFKVPLIFRQESLWQKMACVTINDKISDVPYQMTGKPISTDLMINYWERIKNKLFQNTRFAYNIKHKNPRKDTLSDEALKNYLLNGIGNDPYLKEILNLENTINLIHEHFSGRHNHTNTILNLASIIKFCDLFINGRCQDFPDDAANLLKSIPYSGTS